MNLNDLFKNKGIKPDEVIVMRHSPHEQELKKVLPWFAQEKPEIFNAYQSTHSVKVEDALLKAKYIASFIGHEAGKARFIGLYKINGASPMTYNQYWKRPENLEMKKFGMVGFQKDQRSSCLWFDLELLDFYAEWKGKLIVKWPPPERSWWRWAYKNEMAILTISEENALAKAMPDWDKIKFSWAELSAIPSSWCVSLSKWRGIYYIFDRGENKGYVGSAYGSENLWGRWRYYAKSGHGDNKLLRKCNSENFIFTILQRVSPDMDKDEIIKLENAWKDRLHTRAPYGLNDN